jgi:hypothetical protein
MKETGLRINVKVRGEKEGISGTTGAVERLRQASDGNARG